MKSVVVEIKGRFAAVLSDDGSFKKIKNKNYVVGQEILPELLILPKEDGLKVKSLFTKKSVLCTVCVAVMLLCSGISVWAYASPYSYVSLDVNPSIEYTLNRFKRVIRVFAINDDGQAILNEIDIAAINHKSIEDAIFATVQQISKEGYFTGSYSGSFPATASEAAQEPVAGSATYADGCIVITVSSGNTKLDDKFVSEIREAVRGFVNESVEVEVSSVGLERVEEARELGVTPGKLNVVEKLRESTGDPDSVVVEEWLHKPVKDIMKEIKKNRKTSSVKATDSSAKRRQQEDSTPSGQYDAHPGKTKKEKTPDKGQEKSDSAKKTKENDSSDPEQKMQNKEERESKKAESRADKAVEKEQYHKKNISSESSCKAGNNKNNAGRGKENREKPAKKSKSGKKSSSRR